MGCHEIFLNSMIFIQILNNCHFLKNISYLYYNNKQCDENIILKNIIYHYNLILALNKIIIVFLLFYFTFAGEE